MRELHKFVPFTLNRLPSEWNECITKQNRISHFEDIFLHLKCFLLYLWAYSDIIYIPPDPLYNTISLKTFNVDLD